MKTKLGLISAGIALFADSHSFVVSLQKYSRLHLSSYFLMQATAFALAAASFAMLIPLIRRGPEKVPAEVSKSFDILGVSVNIELSWYVPFFLVGCALLLLYRAKRAEMTLISRSAEAITNFFTVYDEGYPPIVEQSSSRRAIARASKLARWYIILITEGLKASVCLALVLFVNLAALVPILISLVSITIFSVWSYRAIGEGPDGRVEEERDEIQDFVSFRLSLSKLSIAFSALMPVFLVCTLLWDQLVLAEWHIGRDLLLLCLILSFLGTCLGKMTGGLYRMSQMDPIWRAFGRALELSSIDIARDALSAPSTRRDGMDGE